MKSRTVVALLAVLACAGAASGQQKATSISAPAVRERVLADLDQSVAPPAGAERRAPKVAKDPFNPPAADLVDLAQAAAAAAEVQAMSDRQVIETLSAKIQPSGSVTLNGEPYLLFTEKRLKIGEFITIVHEGVEYKLEILSIENNRFRMRYRAEEIIRPIK